MNMNEPKLRFKADDGSQFPDWEEKTIDELGTFTKGAPLSKADISECGSPLILYGELYTTYKEVAYNIQRKTQAVVDEKYYSCVGDVIIPTSGESAEDISTATCVMTPGVVLGGDLNIFRSNILDGRIMSYILNHQAKWKIAAIAQGKSIVHIQAKQLSNIHVKYPVSKAEQQKIADFLSTIDTVIAKQKETVSAWEERKKGVMQKLFSQEVRFKADDGSDFPEWEEKKLEDITSQYKVRNKKRLPLEIYSVNNIVGFIPQSEQFDDAGYLKDTDTSIYMIVPPKHFAYNPARLDVGSIGYQYLDHDVQVSSLYEVFETSNLVNDEFLWSWFHTHYFNNVVKRLQEGGVRLYFYYDKMQEVKIGLPSLPEQQKIADCLSSLDEVIEKQKATLAAWEELKKGLLQQMFA